VAIGLCGVLGLRDFLPGYFVNRIVLVPLFAVLILTAASCAGTLKFLEHRLLVLLGDASYSLYILHLPVYYWLLATLRRLHINGDKSIPVEICYLVSIFTISVLSHKWIELPVRTLMFTRRMSPILVNIRGGCCIAAAASLPAQPLNTSAIDTAKLGATWPETDTLYDAKRKRN